jgi:CubicO group peptidase (beta-lactamase class C family)
MLRAWFAALLTLPLAMSAQTSASVSLDGIWLGTLHTGGPNLRVQFHFHQDAAGKWTCSLDSLDQSALGIPCTLKSAVNPVSVEVPAVHGRFTGSLTANTLDGIWTQGADLPLTLTRQTAVAEPAARAQPDAALPPVSLDGLQAVLDRDLAAQLKTGILAPGMPTGFTIGVVQHGVRRILTYGAAKPDSVFEIGSISKTFTATILAQMVVQHTVRLDEPVRELLPPGTVAKPASGREITLLSLSDQHSGLPRMPDNFNPADPANPYADYDAKALYSYISRHGVALPENAPFGYSNLGVGLLGQALANRAGMPYPQLLQEEVTGPLGMSETGVALTPSMRARFIQGYNAAGSAAHAWDLDALAGAGAIRSTANDMLTYLEAQLHPDKLSAEVLTTPAGATLPAAIALTHELHAEAGPGMHIALNWLQYDGTGSLWHNGATGGYSSFALFNPRLNFAVIVLANNTAGPRSITDQLGLHVAQRLEGRPAVSLAPQS